MGLENEKPIFLREERGLAKDPIQLTAYAQALHAMGHPLAPVKGFIAYIMRDGESIDVVPVDISPIGKSEKLFHVAHDMYDLMRTKNRDGKIRRNYGQPNNIRKPIRNS